MLKTDQYFLLLESKELTKDINLDLLRCNDPNNREPVPSKYYENAKRVSTNVQKIKDYIEQKTGKTLKLKINSGYRTPYWNEHENGADSSYHLIASAIDFKFENYSISDTVKYAKEMMELGLIDMGGLARYNNFIHYDVRGHYQTWNKEFYENTDKFVKRGDLSVYKPVNDDRKNAKTYDVASKRNVLPKTTINKPTEVATKTKDTKYDLRNVDIDKMQINLEDFKNLRVEGGHS